MERREERGGRLAVAEKVSELASAEFEAREAQAGVWLLKRRGGLRRAMLIGCLGRRMVMRGVTYGCET
jgi:hypothetical protein